MHQDLPEYPNYHSNHLWYQRVRQRCTWVKTKSEIHDRQLTSVFLYQNQFPYDLIRKVKEEPDSGFFSNVQQKYNLNQISLTVLNLTFSVSFCFP